MSFDPNTHGAHLVGSGFSIFVDGIRDKCKHVWDGPGYHMISKIGGGEIDKMIANTGESQDVYNAFDKKLRESGYYISGSCVSCSKCGKPFEPPMY
jgi:hypothetical protein